MVQARTCAHRQNTSLKTQLNRCKQAFTSDFISEIKLAFFPRSLSWRSIFKFEYFIASKKVSNSHRAAISISFFHIVSGMWHFSFMQNFCFEKLPKDFWKINNFFNCHLCCLFQQRAIYLIWKWNCNVEHNLTDDDLEWIMLQIYQLKAIHSYIWIQTIIIFIFDMLRLMNYRRHLNDMIWFEITQCGIHSL